MLVYEEGEGWGEWCQHGWNPAGTICAICDREELADWLEEIA